MDNFTDRPMVSIIVPCRNEENFIAACLDSILASDYQQDRLEVFVVDGMSCDRTRVIIEDYARRHAFIRPLDNPKGITPAAFNLGIQHAKGDVIMIMGAHARYPPNYLSGLVAWLDKSGADNVGGVCVTVPSDETPLAQAIAIGLSHPFGVGNAYFRIGTSEPRWVDTVFGGCYRRDVFERIGLFDEQLARNQDDEFNHRLLQHGGRILLVPDVVSYYYARQSLVKLWQMYYQYGHFKPLVARKIGKVMTVRQLIPAWFVLSVLVLAMLAPWSWLAEVTLVTLILAYAVADIACAVAAGSKNGIACGLWLCVVFPVLHVSYGLGFLRGILDFLILGRHRVVNAAAVPISR